MCCTFEKQKRFTITNVFQEKLDKSGHKSNKIWVDKGSEFYEWSIKSWPKYYNIEAYSAHN